MRILRWAWFDLLDWFDRRGGLPLPVTIAVVGFCLLAIVGQIQHLRGEAPAVAPTPALPVILIATAQPQPQPTEPVIEVAAVRYVVAFDQPNGTPMGPIPAPAVSAIQARYGADWLMLEWNGGPAWVRAADVGMGPAVVDIAPTMVPAAPRVIYVASQPQAGPQVSEPATVPTEAPYAPPVPTVAPWVPVPAVVKASDFQEPNPGRCAFVGCLPGR